MLTINIFKLKVGRCLNTLLTYSTDDLSPINSSIKNGGRHSCDRSKK